MWTAVVSQIETHMGGGGKGGRERFILHTCIPTSPCCQLYSCCPAANLERQLNAFARNYVGTFSETPICSFLRLTLVFFARFSPLPKEVGTTLNTDLCSSKPHLRLQDLQPAWLWLSMEEEVMVCRASNSHVPQGGIKITRILNGL